MEEALIRQILISDNLRKTGWKDIAASVGMSVNASRALLKLIVKRNSQKEIEYNDAIHDGNIHDRQRIFVVGDEDMKDYVSAIQNMLEVPKFKLSNDRENIDAVIIMYNTSSSQSLKILDRQIEQTNNIFKRDILKIIIGVGNKQICNREELNLINKYQGKMSKSEREDLDRMIECYGLRSMVECEREMPKRKRQGMDPMIEYKGIMHFRIQQQKQLMVPFQRMFERLVYRPYLRNKLRVKNDDWKKDFNEKKWGNIRSRYVNYVDVIRNTIMYVTFYMLITSDGNNIEIQVIGGYDEHEIWTVLQYIIFFGKVFLEGGKKKHVLDMLRQNLEVRVLVCIKGQDGKGRFVLNREWVNAIIMIREAEHLEYSMKQELFVQTIRLTKNVQVDEERKQIMPIMNISKSVVETYIKVAFSKVNKILKFRKEIVQEMIDQFLIKKI